MIHKKVMASALCMTLSTLCLFSMYSFHGNQNINNIPNTEKGLQKLVELESQSIKDAEIKTKQAKQKINQKNINKNSLSDKFNDSVILGDSLAESILEYQLLPSQCVLAKRGRNTMTCDLEIRQAISLSPEIIFMSYGMNDLEYFNGNSHRFIAQYESQIRVLQTALPDTKIYVNSIIPMDPDTYQNHPHYKKYKEYNEQIKAMCQRLNITYIDNDETMDWHSDIYERDGVHPKYPYYSLWLLHMADVAEL